VASEEKARRRIRLSIPPEATNIGVTAAAARRKVYTRNVYSKTKETCSQNDLSSSVHQILK
jgi:hypothetical protein